MILPGDETTWCTERINDTDVEYVRKMDTEELATVIAKYFRRLDGLTHHQSRGISIELAKLINKQE